MGAPDKQLFQRLIPKESIGHAAAWRMRPLGEKQDGNAPRPGPQPPPPTPAQIEAQAYERGRKAGFDEAMQLAQQARAMHAAQLDEALGALRGRFAELESAGADAVLALSFEIARQVLRREVRTDRAAVLPAARESLAMVIDTCAHPRIHLHPDDLAIVRDELDDDGRYKGCRFIADGGVERGGCRVETPQGEVDATLQTRWHRVLATIGHPEVPLGPAGAEAPRGNGGDGGDGGDGVPGAGEAGAKDQE